MKTLRYLSGPYAEKVKQVPDDVADAALASGEAVEISLEKKVAPSEVSA